MLLRRVLLHRQSKSRLVLASIGALIGMQRLLNALQLYYDLNYLFTVKKDDVIANTYLEINKDLSLLNTLSVVSTYFTEKDLKALEARPEVKRVAPFTSTKFSIWATVKGSDIMPGIPDFNSDFFVEGLPDNMIDLKSHKWRWHPGDAEIPLIAPRSQLTILNFAYLPSKGVPSIPEEMVFRIPIRLEIRHPETNEKIFFKARVIALSDRVNSVVAPLTFVQYANATFGKEIKPPTRVLVEVDDPGDPRFHAFLEDQGYETNLEKLNGGRLRAVLSILFLVVAVVGGFIVLLSVLVFVLTFELMIGKASGDIRLLIQLGYPHVRVSRLFNRYLLSLFLCIQLVAFLVLFLTKYLLNQQFKAYALEVLPGVHWAVFAWGLLFALVFSLFGVLALRQTVKKLAH
jgi:hypothetical protein